MSGQVHATAALPPWKGVPGTHWIGSWVGPRASLHDVEKRKFLPSPRLELRHLSRLARSYTEYAIAWGAFLLYVLWCHVLLYTICLSSGILCFHICDPVPYSQYKSYVGPFANMRSAYQVSSVRLSVPLYTYISYIIWEPLDGFSWNRYWRVSLNFVDTHVFQF
jgi:hypothetical protein